MGAREGSPAPPNSLDALRACLEAGADWVEIDVTALADSDYLIVHDPELESETSGQGAVAALSPHAARALYIKHQDQVTRHPVPLLSDVVELFRASPGQTQLQLDFKNVIPFPADEPLRRLIHLIEPLGARVLVSSTADWQLRQLRRLAPSLRLGFDIMLYLFYWQPNKPPRIARHPPYTLGAYGYYDDHPLASARIWSAGDYLLDRCESLMGLVPNVSVFYIEHSLLAQSLEDGFNWAEPLHARGVQLAAWTMDVTDPVARATAPKLYKAGVDLFASNTPRALSELLRMSPLQIP